MQNDSTIDRPPTLDALIAAFQHGDGARMHAWRAYVVADLRELRDRRAGILSPIEAGRRERDMFAPRATP